MRSAENIIPRSNSAFVSILAVVVLAIFLVAGVALASRPAAAQSDIAPRADIVKLLGDRYKESPVSLGLANNGGVIEVFTAGDGSTWTIVLTMPNGMSRVIATGESWTAVAQLMGQRI